MRITARQLGRIEAACYGLAEFTKNNSVATTLVNTIREQLDEVLSDASDLSDNKNIVSTLKINEITLFFKCVYAFLLKKICFGSIFLSKRA